MKRFTTAIALTLLLTPPVLARQQSVLARVTVYWSQDKGSTGARLRPGHCAVDPNKIPYGSKVMFPDGPCVAVDTGPAVISRKAARRAGRTASQRSAIVVDRYFTTKSKAMAWARANPHFMTLRVLAPGERAEPKEPSPARENITGSNSAAPLAKAAAQTTPWMPKFDTPEALATLIINPILPQPRQ